MIYLGVSAIKLTPVDAKMAFFSLDIDVLVLLIANFDHLPRKSPTSLFLPYTANKINMEGLLLGKSKSFVRIACFHGRRHHRAGFMGQEKNMFEALL